MTSLPEDSIALLQFDLCLSHSSIQFSSVQSLSRVRLCEPMNCSTPGLPVHHHLPEFTQTHDYLIIYPKCLQSEGFPGGTVMKNPSASAGDTGSILGLGRSPGGGNGTPLQYSCLGTPMDGGAWRATEHGVTKSCHDCATSMHRACLQSKQGSSSHSFL